MSAQPPYQPAEPQKEGTGTIILKILLVLVGVVVVLGLGIMLGMVLTSSSRADTTPPDVSPPTPAPDSPYLVANGAVNVRTGPSTDYPILGTAQDGQLPGSPPDAPNGVRASRREARAAGAAATRAPILDTSRDERAERAAWRPQIGFRAMGGIHGSALNHNGLDESTT